MRTYSALTAALVLTACTSATSNNPPTSDAGAQPRDAAGDSAVAIEDAGTDAPIVLSDASPSDAAINVSTIGKGHLTGPQNIAVDGTTNKIYVADFGGSVGVFGADGTYEATYNGGDAGPKIVNAVGIALDANAIYVGDYGANAVVKLDRSGNYIASFTNAGSGVPALGAVGGLAIDANGILYVCDDVNGRVVKFDTSGNPVGIISTLPAGTNSLGTTAVALDGTNVWITQYYDQVIAEFGADGSLTATYGTASTTPGLGVFQQPYNLVINTNHELYIADNSLNTVQTFNATTHTFGAIIASTNAGGATIGQPTGVAVTADGTVLISDSTNAQLVILPP